MLKHSKRASSTRPSGIGSIKSIGTVWGGSSLGTGAILIGFVNVLWDGLVHAWLQDTMVAKHARHQGVGTALVVMVIAQVRQAGCEWLHVDFEGHLRPFYFDACGFRPTDAGLIAL
jgi:GNAT superfamily N-acetyltransferase